MAATLLSLKQAFVVCYAKLFTQAKLGAKFDQLAFKNKEKRREEKVTV